MNLKPLFMSATMAPTSFTAGERSDSRWPRQTCRSLQRLLPLLVTDLVSYWSLIWSRRSLQRLLPLLVTDLVPPFAAATPAAIGH